MHAVIFEVEPAAGKQQDYLDLAAKLRPELEKIDGFVSIERFSSLTTPGKSCRCHSGAMKPRSSSGGSTRNTIARSGRAAAEFLPITGCASRRSCAITACTTAPKPRSSFPIEPPQAKGRDTKPTGRSGRNICSRSLRKRRPSARRRHALVIALDQSALFCDSEVQHDGQRNAGALLEERQRKPAGQPQRVHHELEADVLRRRRRAAPAPRCRLRRAPCIAAAA